MRFVVEEEYMFVIAVKQPNQVTEMESPRVCFVLSDAGCLGFPFNICALQSYNRQEIVIDVNN